MARTLHLARTFYRPRRPVPGMGVLDTSVTRMRVTLTDLDIYLHVNNGAYLQMMDVARTNYLADLGAFGTLRARGWYPVVAASTMTYKRSLRLGERFEIATRVLSWDHRVIYLEQVFRRSDAHVARGLVAGRFLHRGGARIAAPDVVAALRPGLSAPELPADVRAWASAVDVAHRGD
ncbi:acyl-CoA thioesterase [Isoptericola sp. b441]|uniref:Acyl-CoA thioesterase n=1 Tax=Actinotalea lenta TaxID=3064654 RepID=A0ABT9DAN9_9CELL|nr:MULTISPECIES: acyl-CoA thioesterase [unclassified Isoptericola]MDO8107972.1 acyl-CoA thioesterase [Isoptericola sp. b441]MDO8120361.1 acyl-CoA thioesterase [Isoptericola sp. b490]